MTVQKARDGKHVSVEAQAACNAFRDIPLVIELVQTRRFQDEHLPQLMDYLRAADGTKPMPKRMWQISGEPVSGASRCATLQ